MSGRTKSVILAGALFWVLFFISRRNYLLFHSLAETFAIAIACGIFMMGWNTRQFLNNGYLMLLGIAYLFVGGIDFVHMLAYKGMGVFPGYTTDEPTQLWIATRFVEGLSLLIAPLLLRRSVRARWIFAGYSILTGGLLLSILDWDVFPACFVENRGLTTFKVVSEYAICLMLLVAVGLLLKNRQAFERGVVVRLAASMFLTIAAEMAFTLYNDAYGMANLAGHYLKIISFYLVYKAIIQTGLAQPYALLFRDLKEVQEKLVRANEDLEQKVRERTGELRETIADLEQFSYSIVHDMRAPLRSMNAFSTLVLQDCSGKLEPEHTDYLQRIVSAARRLDALIQDVLSYSKVARADAAPVNVELGPLVDEIVRGYPCFHADEADIEICQPLLPVRGNTALLTLCISNLLGNAVKFIRPGTRPRVRVWTEANGNGAVRLAVHDNGIGIESCHLNRIWRIFERLHHSHEYPGTGIGLSVVKRAVERMNGKVGVESQPGSGSTFWLELPKAG